LDLGKKINEQVSLEKLSRQRGIDRVRSRNKQLKESENMSMTKSGRALIAMYIDKIAKAVEEEIVDKIDNGKGGRQVVSLRLLQVIETEIAAAIALSALLNATNRTTNLTTVALDIGKKIEDEIKARVFEEVNPALYKKTYADVYGRSFGYRYKRRKLFQSATTHGIDLMIWTRREKMMVGTRMLESIDEHTDLTEIYMKQYAKKRRWCIELSEQAIKWIGHRDFLQGLNEPEYLPMVVRPRPWKGVMPDREPSKNLTGGYITPNIKQPALIKTHSNDYLHELSNFDLSQMFRPINQLQDTRWRVDTDMLDAAQQLWDNESTLGRLPEQGEIILPPKPHDIETNVDARKQWKHEVVKARAKRARGKSHRRLVGDTLRVAQQFKDQDDLHFVYTCDFRGRAYPMTSYLQPQGADLGRSLLRFADAEGKAMTDAGARELAIYGASLFGHDKGTMDERVEWVEENSEDICRSGDNPFDNRFWTFAGKKSFTALAFCKEWLGWKRDGSAFYTTLPVMRDGTCNSIQHWAAILRDPVAGALVNLTPADIPGDAYVAALDILVDRLKRIAGSNLEGNDIARGWLDYGLDRALAKKPTMTLSYGAKRYSMTDGIDDWIADRADGGIPEPFDGKYFGQAIWLTNEIWASIKQTVGSAMIGMKYLQDLVNLCLNDGLPISWITPTGMYVRQAYYDMKPKRVKMRLLGDTIRLTLNESIPDKYDRHAMVNGIAANFIHSLDASAMYMTMNKAMDQGVQAFSMIHDSYGTTAVDTPILSQCTREAFVELYRDTDHLEAVRDHVKPLLSSKFRDRLPSVPKQGSLDIESVLQSDHFFS